MPPGSGGIAEFRKYRSPGDFQRSRPRHRPWKPAGHILSATIREYCFILESTFQAGARFGGYDSTYSSSIAQSIITQRNNMQK